MSILIEVNGKVFQALVTAPALTRSSWLPVWHKRMQPFRQQIRSCFTEEIGKKAIWDQLQGTWGIKVQQSWIPSLQQGQGNCNPSQHSFSWALQHDSLRYLTTPKTIRCNDWNIPSKQTNSLTPKILTWSIFTFPQFWFINMMYFTEFVQDYAGKQ